MLSIIICSKNPKLASTFFENIKETVGVEHEIICIDNSENKYSIFSAYNRGMLQSNFENLCFVHEDVIFHNHNWGEKIINHLDKPGTGILGLAGGDLATKVPSSWAALNPSMNIIQSDRSGKHPTKHIRIPDVEISRSVILLDGVFLCMKKSIFEKIRFDEELGGFHGYDFDICIQSILAGYLNYVIYDIKVEHHSHGNMNIDYKRSLIKVFKKWEGHLPLVEHKISDEEKEQILPLIERKRLYRLLKRLIRTGFPTNEIVEVISYYTKLIGSERSVNLLVILRLRIFMIRISSRIRNKK